MDERLNKITRGCGETNQHKKLQRTTKPGTRQEITKESPQTHR